MQKLFYTLLLITSLSIHAQTPTSYPLDSEKSVLNWKGTYAFQFSEHHGTVQFKEGWIKTKNKTVTDGLFIIDMTTITNADHQLKQGPVEHLKNDDFFDVPTYPEAKLKFTRVTYFEEDNLHKIEANLTIKNKTVAIEFWATIDGTKKTLNTQFKIDRRDWGITYNNKAKNHAISDAIEFEAHLFF